MIHYDTERGLTDLPQIVDQAVRDLSGHADEFDSIAAQGTSGLIVAAPVSLALHKPLVVVRKDAELTAPHCIHIRMVENAENAGGRILFLDDYVGEGKTLRNVVAKLVAYTSGALAARYEYSYGLYTAGGAALRARWA